MKDNDISSNSIYRVSEKRREKEKMVFGEGADHQDLRVYYEGREQRRITYTVCLYTDFLWLCVEKQRAGFVRETKKAFNFGNRLLHDLIDQTNLRCKDLITRWVHVYLKTQQQRQNICQLVLQPHSPHICAYAGSLALHIQRRSMCRSHKGSWRLATCI